MDIVAYEYVTCSVWDYYGNGAWSDAGQWLESPWPIRVYPIYQDGTRGAMLVSGTFEPDQYTDHYYYGGVSPITPPGPANSPEDGVQRAWFSSSYSTYGTTVMLYLTESDYLDGVNGVTIASAEDLMACYTTFGNGSGEQQYPMPPSVSYRPVYGSAIASAFWTQFESTRETI